MDIVIIFLPKSSVQMGINDIICLLGNTIKYLDIRHVLFVPSFIKTRETFPVRTPSDKFGKNLFTWAM